MRVVALVPAAAAVLAGSARSGGRALPAKDTCSRASVANIDLLVDSRSPR